MAIQRILSINRIVEHRLVSLTSLQNTTYRKDYKQLKVEIETVRVCIYCED